MREALRRHPVALFLVLVFPLSWYPWLLALARGTTTGPNPLGPLVAALIVTGVVSGFAGERALLRKLIVWRVGVVPWLVAVGLPMVICCAGAALAALLAHERVVAAAVRWQDVAEQFLFIFLFIGLGEEPGWRGFLLPQLQRRWSSLGATSIVAGVWAVWHVPLFGSEFAPSVIPQFLLALAGVSFVQTWLSNRSAGSVLLQMVMHATVNTIGSGLVFRWFSAGDVVTLWWINAALWVVAGAACALLDARARSAANRFRFAV